MPSELNFRGGPSLSPSLHTCIQHDGCYSDEVLSKCLRSPFTLHVTGIGIRLSNMRHRARFERLDVVCHPPVEELILVVLA